MKNYCFTNNKTMNPFLCWTSAAYIILTFVSQVTTKNCVKIDQCSCEMDDDSGTIDLTKIGKPAGEPPLIKDVPAAGGFSYSFNPCIPFDEGKACKNVAGCQIDAVGRVDYDIGAADKVTFSFDNKNNYLVGTYESADRVRHSVVNYICDPTVDPPKTSVAGEVQSATYSFSIVSKYACPTYVPPKVNCTQLDQCSCRFDDGRGTVDLSGIAMHGTPLISDVKAGLYYYSFNPCFPFTEGTCNGVAGCQLENSSKSEIYTDIAAVSSVDLSYDGNNIVGNYTSTDGSRNTIVTYVCDPAVEKPIAIVNGEPCERTYAFTIVSKDICPKEPTVTAEASANETLYFLPLA